MLDAFIGQFYVDRPPPRLVLLSHAVPSAETLCEVLTSRVGHRIDIEAPSAAKRRIWSSPRSQRPRGPARQLAEGATQKNLLEGVAKRSATIARRRIEVYDNSHISGTNAVGAMVVAGGGLRQEALPHLQHQSADLTPGDDFGMMREVLTRRFARLIARAKRRRPAPCPIGPMSSSSTAARAAQRRARGFAALGVEGVTFIGIAKGEDRDAGREKFFIEGREAFMLPHRDPVLYFVQRLRDEAHRFAIGTHRARRKKDFVKNPLDEIDGIGPTRKRALLRLRLRQGRQPRRPRRPQKTPGLNAATAKLVYDFFRESRA